MLNKILISRQEMADVLANPWTHDVVWPTGGDKKLALSFTKLETFVTCPRQFAEKFIWQTIPYRDTPATLWGTEVHDALENYVLNGKPITAPAIKPFTSVADALIQKENNLFKRGILTKKIFGEQQWACTLSMKEHSWFDNNGVFLRGKADVGMGTKNTLYLYDYKTGKGSKPKPEQLELMGLLGMAQKGLVLPSMTKIDGNLLFLEARKSVPFSMPVASAESRWREWVKKAFVILDAYQRDSFPEKQSGLCGKWCDAFDCPFNGRNPDGSPKK